MFSTTKIKSALVAFVLMFAFSIPGLLHAQHDSYMGTETKLSDSELLSKAESTDFNDNISTKLFQDEKNSYFAVDVSKLPSKYEKIRILELSFADNALVSIGSDDSMKYYFFLVNNTLNKSADEIEKLFNEYSVQSKTELQAMNEEQIRLWLIQHDKYSKK